MNPGEGEHEQTIRDVSVVNSQNVTFNQTQIIQISVEEVKTRRFIITSPYKGLKKFDSEDKDRFFGRDQFLTGLVNELEQTNLVLLLGASGSGKSSVIRAGLIPWLLEKQGSCFVNLVFTPDQDPFESLYASLLGKYKQSEAKTARVAKEDTLTQVVRSLQQKNACWFILIDQFEELFTTSESSKRDIFIKSLIQLVRALDKAGDRSVKIVATMRADFLDRLSPYPALVKATDKHRPMIAEMQLDELRLAIEQPAAHHGVVFETGLVRQIVDDVQGQAGYLPLLQYTLNLLWETEVQSQSIENRTLNISNYRKLGGVRGALQEHIDLIYKSLSESEKLATQRIFLRLVGIGGDEESGTDWKPVRRRASHSEFSDPLEQTVLTQLINQNLLVSNRVTESQESTIEIAHEVLLTSWVTLNNWIKGNRQAIALRNRLNDDLLQWKRTNANDDLWSGYKLDQILELRQEPTFNDVLGGLSKEANRFVDISAQRQRNRNLLRTGVAVAIAGIASVSLFQWRENRFQEDFSAVLVGGSTNPKSLYVLDRALKIAKREADQGNTESASETYQNIQTVVQRYRSAIDSTPQLFQEADVARIGTAWTIAEAGLIDIVKLSLLPKLEAQLAAEWYGELIDGSEFTDYEQQFTEGALQTTYQILMRTPGCGADINDTGEIENVDEAMRMPCTILESVESLWRTYTDELCGFYGDKSDDLNSVYTLDSDCTLGRTVTLATFGYKLFSVIDQIESCPALRSR